MPKEIDIDEMMGRLDRLVKDKAKYELLAQQLKEDKAALEKRMREAQVDPKNLDGKIAELERSIENRIRAAESQPAGV